MKAVANLNRRRICTCPCSARLLVTPTSVTVKSLMVARLNARDCRINSSEPILKFIICMITGCQQKLCAVAVLLVVTSAPTLAAPTGKILITLDKHQNPVVEYIVGPEVSELTFPENNPRIHQLVRSNSWLPENKCAAIESGRLLRKSSACRFRYTLTWDSAPIDRLYPPLVRLVNGGVMIFTEYPLVSVDGRGLPMEVLAPAGMVVAFWGQKAKTRVAIPATVFQDDPRGWIYIGPDKFVNEAAANMLIDDGMPSTVAAVITQVSADVLKLFTKKFDVAPAGKPSFYLEWSRRDRPGRSFQADVVPGGVIRLGLSGEGWKNASERDIATFRNVAAHEIAHFWNSGIFKPIVPAMPWLYEGNAELLSIAALYQLKVYDAQAASDRINNSLNECLLTIGDSAWSKFEDRNRGTIPYTCGLALQIAIAGAHHREHPREDVFTFWRAVWRESPRYDENLVLAFMGKTGLANQAAQLRSLLRRMNLFAWRCYACSTMRASRQCGRSQRLRY